jgi:ATP-binding cassette subfamily B protein
LRRQIGLVPQNTILFRTTIRENIRAGWLDATDVEVEEAACAAGIQEFIMSLPQGYDTLLGQDGRQLSGGQAQRIAVARALLRKPEIMILDEATASLDSEAEAGILSSILNLKGHCTIIAITHRLVLARNADRILVLQSGSIVEDGHHEKLLTANGLYASLWRQRNIELA